MGMTIDNMPHHAFVRAEGGSTVNTLEISIIIMGWRGYPQVVDIFRTHVLSVLPVCLAFFRKKTGARLRGGRRVIRS